MLYTEHWIFLFKFSSISVSSTEGAWCFMFLGQATSDGMIGSQWLRRKSEIKTKICEEISYSFLWDIRDLMVYLYTTTISYGTTAI